MFKKAFACNFLLATLAAHAQTPALQAPCNIPAQAPLKASPIYVTTSPTVDTGALINNAINQAVSNGSNMVVVNSSGSPAPMTTGVILNNLSNFTIQMNPGVDVYGYQLRESMFTVAGGYNIKINGGRLNAGSPGLNSSSCVSVFGNDSAPANSVELNGLECYSTTSNGISLSGTGTSYSNIQNVSIHNTLIHETGSTNIYASGVDNLCMQSNILVNPATGGVYGGGDPANVAVAYSENVYFGQNYVAGTPYFFRQPNPSNTPPSGFYAFASENVNTDTNTFVNTQCTVATCSGTGDLPSSPSAVHDDTVLNAININNYVDTYGIGITCELSWSCSAVGGYISNAWDYGLYDESNRSEIGVNALTSTAGLTAGAGVTLQTVSDVINGNPTPVVQASIPGNGLLFAQNLGSVMNDGVEPFPEIWVKSASGEPAGGLALWFSADSSIFDAHTKISLPALTAGQWTRVALAPAHISLMGLEGVLTWGLVNPANHNSDTVSVSDYRQIADSRNNTYSGVTINSTGAYPLDVSGCGSNTTFVNNTITNPGSTGVWPYYNSGLIGQVFIGGYDNCVRSGVYFTNNITNLDASIQLGGSSLFNFSNYGAYNTINGVVLTNNKATGPYSAVQNVFVINNAGASSTIATPTVQ